MSAANFDNKLVIPYAGKMFRSSISKNNKALCFVLNKGYFETKLLEDMLIIISSAKDIDGVVIVGSIDKVAMSDNKSVVYRQRIFFKSLRYILELCKLLGLKFELSSNFRIGINSILNCTDELIYIERYAHDFKQTVDEWLTNCCIVHLNYLLLSMGMYSDLSAKSKKILDNKIGYLDRSPFLVASYNIDNKSSGIFLEMDTSNRKMYSQGVENEALYNTYGYTTKNVARDVKGGVFK